jgi:hypothetical protein
MISGYLSNAHAELGYTEHDDVPAMPLCIKRANNKFGGGAFEVQDKDGAWMADFRNHTDAKRFVATYGVKGLQQSLDDANRRESEKLGRQIDAALGVQPSHEPKENDRG